MGKKIFVRDQNIKKTAVIYPEFDKKNSIRKIKRSLKNFWGYESLEKLCLFYQDVELTEGYSLDTYGIEEFDLLVLTHEDDPRLNSIGVNETKDREIILKSKEWLDKNIGVEIENIELTEFSRSENDEKKIIFEDREGESIFKLSFFDNKIKEYEYDVPEKDVKKEES